MTRAARAKWQPSYEVLYTLDYDLVADALKLEVDSAEYGRGYQCVWNSTARDLHVVCHWGHESADRDETWPLRHSEQVELWRWFDSSDDITDLVSEMRETALEREDPRP